MSGRDEEASSGSDAGYDAVEPTLDPEQHCAFIRAQEKEIAYDEVRLSYLNIEKKDSPGNLHVCCPETRGRKNGHHGEAEKEARHLTDIQDIKKSDLKIKDTTLLERVPQLTKSKVPLPIFMVELKIPKTPQTQNKISKYLLHDRNEDTFRKRPEPTQCL
ncbi:hypothetical protein TNIN_292741 [Trichonephila inaurata madagascariensis]|uniref:Uncharacterized protein n=1 Tax=Trichonephila inaurata madagascariensis TaxID=2747483 RepID=A0A8X6YS26_9ARAC|nr:hypothetical protein TNIN_292741 [Trichonephila inaurata madagascariensis]